MYQLTIFLASSIMVIRLPRTVMTFGTGEEFAISDETVFFAAIEQFWRRWMTLAAATLLALIFSTTSGGANVDGMYEYSGIDDDICIYNFALHGIQVAKVRESLKWTYYYNEDRKNSYAFINTARLVYKL